MRERRFQQKFSGRFTWLGIMLDILYDGLLWIFSFLGF